MPRRVPSSYNEQLQHDVSISVQNQPDKTKRNLRMHMGNVYEDGMSSFFTQLDCILCCVHHALLLLLDFPTLMNDARCLSLFA